MTQYNLAALTRRTRNPRRKIIVLRPIIPPATLAGDLYASAYRPIVELWTAAVDPIVAAYERTLAEITTDSPEDIGAQIGAVETSASSVMVALRLQHAEWAVRLERWHRGKWRGAVLTATGVDVSTLIGADDMRMTMGAAVERNVGLVKSVSDQTRARIGDIVFRGFQRRAPSREVAREIREAVGMGRRRALNVASDQNVKLASALNDERRREAGLDTWEWMSSHKVNYRPEHAARDGKRYSDDPADKRPAPADRPGDLPYCGCTSRAVLSLTGEF